MFSWFRSFDLPRRAKRAAEQMIFFVSACKTMPFNEIAVSAQHAGFIVDSEDHVRKEAGFHWPERDPDFTFYVSFRDEQRIAVTAESYGDIFGLVLVSHSHLPNISVETKQEFGVEMGANALRFRKILLSFPGFDEGSEAFARLFK